MTSERKLKHHYQPSQDFVLIEYVGGKSEGGILLLDTQSDLEYRHVKVLVTSPIHNPKTGVLEPSPWQPGDTVVQITAQGHDSGVVVEKSKSDSDFWQVVLVHHRSLIAKVT